MQAKQITMILLSLISLSCYSKDGEFHKVSTKYLCVEKKAKIKKIKVKCGEFENLTVFDNISAGTETIGDLTVLNNESVGGNLNVTGSVSACDVIVNCNLLLQQSSSSATGNVLKNGVPFIHNYGTNNLFFGLNSGNFVLIGTNNTGLGANTLTSNTTGTLNLAIGENALNKNTTGFNNTGIGYGSLALNTTGFFNTGIGINTLTSTTTGDSNLAIGSRALELNTTGSRNHAIGSAALSLLTSGSNANLALGDGAGQFLLSGSDNIYLGFAWDGITTAESATIRIGQPILIGQIVPQTRTFIYGIRGVTTALNDAIPVLISSDGQLGTLSSSERFKENISPVGLESKKLFDLNPVQFNYKADSTKKLEFGLIAEEVAQIFPDMVVYEEDGTPYTVKYHLLYALIINELKNNFSLINELQNKVFIQSEIIDELKAELYAYKTELTSLLSRLIVLENNSL